MPPVRDSKVSARQKRARKQAKRDVSALAGATLGLIRGTNTAVGRSATPDKKPAKRSEVKDTKSAADRGRAKKAEQSPAFRKAARETYAQAPVERRKEIVKSKTSGPAKDAAVKLHGERRRAAEAQEAAEEFATRLQRLKGADRKKAIDDLSPAERTQILKGQRVSQNRALKDTIRGTGEAVKELSTPRIQAEKEPGIVSRIAAGALTGGVAGPIGQAAGAAAGAVGVKTPGSKKVAKAIDPSVRAATEPLNKALQQLTRGSSATAGIADALTSGRPDRALQEGWEGLIKNDKSWETIARKVGMDGKDAEFAGFLGDIFGDPTTYIAFGAQGAAKSAGREAARRATKAVEIDVAKATAKAAKRGITIDGDTAIQLQQYARRQIAAAQKTAEKQAARKKTVGGTATGARKGIQVGLGVKAPTRTVAVVPARVSKAAAKVGESPVGRFAEKFSPARMPASWRKSGLSESDWVKFRDDLRSGRARAVRLEREMGNLARLVRSAEVDAESYKRIIYAIERGSSDGLAASEREAYDTILPQLQRVRDQFAEYGVRLDLVDTITPAKDLQGLLGDARKAAAGAKRTTRANIRVASAIDVGKTKRVKALRAHGNQTRNPDVRAAKKEADAATRAAEGAARAVPRAERDAARSEASLINRLRRVEVKAANARGRAMAAEARLPRGTNLDDAAAKIKDLPEQAAARQSQIDDLYRYLDDPKASADLIPTIERLEKELSDFVRESRRTGKAAVSRAVDARSKARLADDEVAQARADLQQLRDELHGAKPSEPRKGVIPAPATPAKIPAAKDALRVLQGDRRVSQDRLRELHKMWGAVTERDLDSLARARGVTQEWKDRLARLRGFDETLAAGRPMAYEDELRFLEDVVALADETGRPALRARAARALEKAQASPPPVAYVPRKPQEWVDEIIDQKDVHGTIPGGGDVSSQRVPGSMKGRYERRRVEAVDSLKPDYYSHDLPLLLGLYGPEMGQRLGSLHFFSRVMNRHAAPVTLDTIDEGVVYHLAAGGRYEKLGPGEVRNLRAALDRGDDVADNLFVIDRAISEQIQPALGAISPDEFMRFVDKTQRGWKMANTIAKPGFFVNTGVGNTWQLFLRDSLFTRDFAHGVKVFAAMRASERTAQKIGGRPFSRFVERAMDGATVKVDGVRVPIRQIIDEMVEAGAVRAGSRVHDPTELSAVGEAARNAQRKVRPLAAAGQLAEDMDDITKAILYMRGRRQGLTPPDATAFSLTAMIDYGDLTEFERQFMRRLMPFYVYTSRNLPIQIRRLAARPGKLASYEKVRQELAEAAGLPEDWERDLLPTDQERLPFPIPGYTPAAFDGTKTQAMQYLRLPVDDLSRPVNLLFNTERGVQRYLADLSPWLKAFVEPAINRRLDYDRPLDSADDPKYASEPLASILELLGRDPEYDKKGVKQIPIDGKIDYLMRLIGGSYGSAGVSAGQRGTEKGGTNKWVRIGSQLGLGQGHNSPDPRDTARIVLGEKITKRKDEQEALLRGLPPGATKPARYYELQDQLDDLYDQRTEVRGALGYAKDKERLPALQRDRAREAMGLGRASDATPEQRASREAMNELRRTMGLGPKR